MGALGLRLRVGATAITLIAFWTMNSPVLSQTAGIQVDEALQNITTLVRPGRIGYATVWDGNKYIQCRRTPERALRCEAAGTSMQPSLRSVLTGDRSTRLTALGWTLDPQFWKLCSGISSRHGLVARCGPCPADVDPSIRCQSRGYRNCDVLGGKYTLPTSQWPLAKSRWKRERRSINASDGDTYMFIRAEAKARTDGLFSR